MQKNLLLLVGSLLMSGLLACSPAWAGGYRVSLQDQYRIGMGHTGVAVPFGSGAVFFNPGAVSHLERNSISAGVSLISSNVAYRAPGPSNYQATTDNPVGTPFYLYGNYGLGGEGALSGLAFGIGIYTPYGSSVDWEDGWAGSGALEEISLSAIFIQPTVSYNINDIVGIGVGLVVATGSVNLQRSVPVTFEDGSPGAIELDGAANTGLGFNAGLYLKPIDLISFGISYRSKIDLTVEDGDVTATVPGAAQATIPATNEFTATLPLPAEATVGVALMPTDRFTIAVDVNLAYWSAYEELKLEFNEPINGEAESVSPREYNDALTYRLGLEYLATDNLSLRLGGYFDESPVDVGYLTPETPDIDRIGLSAGLGLRVLEDRLRLDLSFLYITTEERSQTREDLIAAGTLASTVDGTFRQRAFIPGVGLSFSL